MQAAPPIPSIVPIALKLLVRHSALIDTIEALQLLKTSYSANTTQVMRKSITLDIRQLERQVIAKQIRNAILIEKLN